MTCIVGLRQDGHIYMGGDSAASNGHNIVTISPASPKVFKHGDIVFGYAQSLRAGQIVQHHFKPPEIKGGVIEYLTGPFVRELRKTLEEYGFQKADESWDEEAENVICLLVGIQQQIYEIWADYAVVPVAESYSSIGCGSDVAVGSLHSTAGMGLTGSERITKALEAAAFHCTDIRPPFVIEEI